MTIRHDNLGLVQMQFVDFVPKHKSIDVDTRSPLKLDLFALAGLVFLMMSAQTTSSMFQYLI